MQPVNKAQAISLIEEIDSTKVKRLAIGDSRNDILMMQMADVSIKFINSAQAIKESTIEDI